MTGTDKNATGIDWCDLAHVFGELAGGAIQNSGDLLQGAPPVHPYMQLNEKGYPLDTGVGWGLEEICKKLRKRFNDSQAGRQPVVVAPDGGEAESAGIEGMEGIGRGIINRPRSGGGRG